MSKTERKKPIQARSKRMLEDILSGTKRAIEKFGIDKISTSKISQQTGISVGSFYQYFQDKETVLLKLTKSLSNSVVESFSKAIENSKDMALEDRVEFLIQLYVEEMYRYAPFVKFMPKIVWTLGQSTFFLKNRAKAVSHIENILKDNIDKDEQECANFAQYLMAVVNGSLHHILQNYDSLEKEYVAQSLTNTVSLLINDFKNN